MPIKKLYELTEEIQQIILERYGTTRAQELADTLNVPVWRVRRWAQLLGIADKKERTWSVKDDLYLEEFFCHTCFATMERKLNRTPRAIQKRAYLLGLTKCSEGYTIASLSEVMGCSCETILAWVSRGLLKGERRNTDRQGDIWYFSEHWVKTFVIENRFEVSKVKVDINWLISLLTMR